MDNKTPVTIIGAGLAGSEAAFQLARRDVPVRLYEMRPERSTPVHETDLPAELVCSNSLGSKSSDSAPGLLKNELRMLDSLIMEAADEAEVPAGQALAVDREKFSRYILDKLTAFPHLEIIHREITHIPQEGIVILATGPLTSEALAESLRTFLGERFLFFFDAVSPIVLTESIDFERVFEASRYGKGTPDYLNCAMNEEEYEAFYQALIHAERIEIPDFEKNLLFEGCMPIEEIAARGRQTLLFGPMKPVGLDDNAVAVVQLRKENREASMYNLVGFQTRLTWPEQKRVFRMIPGLEKAEFARLGVMHKNIYIDSPRVLLPTLQLAEHRNILVAGQLTGVEGYMESTAMGLLAGINAWKIYKQDQPITPPRETATGSLLNHITDSEIKNFQPMNINFGILPPAPKVRGKRKDRRKIVLDNALHAMQIWQSSLEPNLSQKIDPGGVLSMGK